MKPMVRTIAVVTAVALLGASAQAAAQPAVVGTWKLVSYVTETADGKRTFPLGDDAVGMAIYLPNGRVSIQFMKRDRPKFASGDAWRGTLEEERAAFESYFAYAGRYTLDAQRSTVTHHLEISSTPNYVGTDLQRTFTLAGNRLTLRTPPRMLAGQTSTSTLVWERVD
jgi:Lipocalin-like domain